MRQSVVSDGPRYRAAVAVKKYIIFQFFFIIFQKKIIVFWKKMIFWLTYGRRPMEADLTNNLTSLMLVLAQYNFYFYSSKL